MKVTLNGLRVVDGVYGSWPMLRRNIFHIPANERMGFPKMMVVLMLELVKIFSNFVKFSDYHFLFVIVVLLVDVILSSSIVLVGFRITVIVIGIIIIIMIIAIIGIIIVVDRIILMMIINIFIIVSGMIQVVTVLLDYFNHPCIC